MTLVLVVAIPFGTAIAIAIVGGRLGRRTLGILTTIAMALSFGAALSMVKSAGGNALALAAATTFSKPSFEP